MLNLVPNVECCINYKVADFDRYLVVEGVNLELQSLSSLLKNFKTSSIMYLITKSLIVLKFGNYNGECTDADFDRH